jgi:phospholipase/lecithinase/hemolysin
MKQLRSWIVTALATALLVACGGGDPDVPGTGSTTGGPATKGTFSSVVSFGDSLSDLGTYTPATAIPGTNPQLYFGGKWTTNSPTSTIWVENVATSLGLLITPAEVGFAGQSVKCPAALTNAALAATCTGYGQGGARATNPSGPRHASGALTVPLKTQIANHLASPTFGGSFKSTDLIFVQSGGGNEIFVLMDPTIPTSFGSTIVQILTQVQTGAITAAQAQALLLQPQLDAQAVLKQAALETASYVVNEILAKGGKYVAVMNIPDLGKTPEGAASPGPIPGILTTLSQTYNLWLREGLAGQPVQWIDIDADFAEFRANPATYGFVNVTTPACDKAKMSAITGGLVTDGTSLFCNATPNAPYNGLATGADANTWLFADGNHPTTGGHKAFSDAILKQLRAAGWI